MLHYLGDYLDGCPAPVAETILKLLSDTVHTIQYGSRVIQLDLDARGDAGRRAGTDGAYRLYNSYIYTLYKVAYTYYINI